MTPRRVFAGLCLAAGPHAFANALYILLRVPLPRAVTTRAIHHVVDMVETLALAIVAGAIVASVLAYARRVAFPVVAVAAAGIIHVASGSNLWRRIMVMFDGAVEWSLYAVIIALAGVVTPLIYVLGDWLGQFRRAFVIPLVVAAGALAFNNAIQTDQYFGNHCVFACGASIFAGAALARRFEERLPRPDVTRLLPVVLLALWPPSNEVRIALFQPPSTPCAWILTTVLWRPPAAEGAPAAAGSWLAGRSGDAPVAPTVRPLVPGAPVVVLITVDATRADVVNATEPATPLPALAAMKARGVHFTNAVSPGSQTAISLAALFSGRYFSQLSWTDFGKGGARFAYPAADPSPRFPQLLSRAGVATSIVGSVIFLEDSYGVARGFDEQHILPNDLGHAQGADVVDALVARLSAADRSRPAFFYAHLMEPHDPYDRGAKRDGTELERYVSEVAAADALIGRVASIVRERFGDRGVLIVSADHGEAFGEHGSKNHSKQVYEESVRVPLLVANRYVFARPVDTPVGVIDLGPTVLDLFGVPVPPSFMGQSLVPLLAGREVHLSRPLFAEARLHRTFFGEVKVIEDARRHTVEAYDLARDPGERDNVFGSDPRADIALATLRAFFRDAPMLYRP